MNPLAYILMYTKKNFCSFPWVVISTGPGGFMICVCILLREWSWRLNRKWFWRSRKLNLRPLVYKALQLSTTPWGLLGKSTGSDYAVQDCVLCSSYIDTLMVLKRTSIVMVRTMKMSQEDTGLQVSKYVKTCLKRPLKKNTKNCFSIPIIS